MWYSKSLTENKTFEIQVEVCPWKTCITWFNFSMSLSRQTDHAGFQFVMEIMNLYFHVWITDNRHWDYDKNEFQSYHMVG